MGTFTIALKCHLRPREDLPGEAGKLLTDRELELLMSAEHKVRVVPASCTSFRSPIIQTRFNI